LLVFSALLGGGIGVIASPGTSSDPKLGEPWNLVLVSVDALRADRLSAYGYPRQTTPFLRSLLPEVIRFDRFYYSGGGTLPSHLALLTSLSPVTHGIGPEAPARLPESRTTLAEHLRGLGYRTAAWVGGGWLSARFGFDQGFERFTEDRSGFQSIVPAALSWLDEQPGKPFFLFLHGFDVHSSPAGLPYDCPGESERFFAPSDPAGFTPCLEGRCASELLAFFNTRARAEGKTVSELIPGEWIGFFSDLYNGCIRHVDQTLKSFVQGLQARRLWNRTVFVLLSDHGEEFGEHGFLLHDQGGYEELARIPWILRLPHGALGGRRVLTLAAMVDVVPTVLDLLRLPPLPETQGRSQLRAIQKGHPARTDVHMYSVLVTDRFKYFSDERRLFDLLEDPNETRNLYGAKPEVVAELEQLVRRRIAQDLAYRNRLDQKGGPRPVELDEETTARLRALGYLK
jgi:arylsulfatase A-like enzyme